MQYVLLWSPVLLTDRLVCMPCSGQIGFMICSKKAADGSALDTRVPRQPPPQRGDYPPLRCAGIHCFFRCRPCFDNYSIMQWHVAGQDTTAALIHQCLSLESTQTVAGVGAATYFDNVLLDMVT